MKKVEKFFDPNRESPFFGYMKKVVVGQDVSGARSCGAGRHWGNIPGAELCGAGRRGAGRHWGKIPGAERRGAKS